MVAHIRKQEDREKNIKRTMANKYVKPGVYVREVDYSAYTPPKNYKRMKKIARIFIK